MKDQLIKAVVRALFWMTTQRQATGRIQHCLDSYLALCQRMGPEAGRRQVQVPPMLGVDEDMRGWSLFMILEHTTIVNGHITRTVHALSQEIDPPDFDMKLDVTPSAVSGEEQMQTFRVSVEEHLALVSSLAGLRGTSTHRHPFFGHLTAHGWHCMFGLHLRIHQRQAEAVGRILA